MIKIKKKNIKEICNEIDLIIDGKDNKIDYKYIFLHLDDALTKKISYSEILLICETIIKIAKTKNRIIRHLEKDFWSFLNKIPFQIILIQGLDIFENEKLLPNTDYDNTNKRILSRLIGLAQEIIGLKDDNSKGSDLRRAGSIRILGEMINYFHIPDAKNLFVDSINSKNEKEQYAALEGLENYYNVSEDEIEDELVKKLNVIKKETDDRTVASTCLQIQINAGIIDEMIAIFEIDDWKDEHYD
jgi:tRNA-binding EMAP/Myf-like protein